MDQLIKALAEMLDVGPETKKKRGVPVGNVAFHHTLSIFDNNGKLFSRIVGDYDKESDEFWLSERIYDALKGVSGTELFANTPTGKKYIRKLMKTADRNYYGLIKFA